MITLEARIVYGLKRLFTLCTLLLSPFIFLSGQQRWFSVDVRQPAAVELPREAYGLNSLLLVNNAVPQPADFGHKNIAGEQTIENSTIDLTDAARQLLFAAEQALFEQESFGDVSILEVSQNSSRSFFRQQPLSARRADSLLVMYDVEALLVLNQLVIYDNSEIFITVNDRYGNELTGYCTAQWALFIKGKSSPFRFSVSDTLYWSAEESSLESLATAMPERQDALLYLATDAGQRMAQQIMPQWVSEDRYIYLTKHGELDAGLRAFERQQWQKAYKQWQEAWLAATSNMTAAYAMADMAVAAEMNGSYNDAVKAVDKAVEYLFKVKTNEARQQIINLRYYKTRIRK